MSIDQQISQLLSQERCGESRKQTLIFVMGENARTHVEKGLSSEPGKLSSVMAVSRSRQDIDVLFLSRLQYLFMYLMKFEAVETANGIKYNHFVIYGLDDGIMSMERPMQLRLANLICNAAFRIKRKHDLLDVIMIPWDEQSATAKELAKVEEYWRHIC